MTAVGTGRLDWLLDEFARATPGVVHVVVVSGDGLRLASSPGIGATLGDQLSAAASGLVSLARGTAQLLGAGSVGQTILELDGGYYFVTSVSTGATLAVFAERSCDMGVVGYEMTMLATRVGHAVTPAQRKPAER
ncbi:roadblock/LC7 domain-containing protein [Pseudonocardia sp. CA-107938]|uniref:roadblock/LC7 domain-containing protein n=1 Tax=Pseudonocardia sp. CA-107938 TaxID=3240021 RepID=UPI003D938FA1